MHDRVATSVPISAKSASGRAQVCAITDYVADGIVTIDDGGVVLTFNPAAERLFGFSADEVIGRNVGRLMPGLHADEHEQQYESSGQKNVINVLREVVGLRKDGSTFDIELAVSEFWEDNRHRFVGVVRDITARKQAEEQNEALARFPQENPFPVLKVSMDGILLYANLAGEPLLRSWQCQPGEKLPAEFVLALYDAVETGLCTEIEVECDERAFLLVIAPFPDAGYAYLYGHDITERKKAQWELAAYADETAALNQALTQACLEAEAATRAKTNFLANMSHEIRTPMTAILGFVDVLAKDVVTADGVEAIEIIKRNGQHLLEIINDILDLSKIESGKLEVEHIECSPCQILSDVASLMRVRASAKDLALEVYYDGPMPQTIQSDPTRLRQILINLVSNAVKFTEVGEVRLVARLLDAECDEPKMQFEIVDSGIGMTDQQITKLFTPFHQADTSTTRQFGGTGLGLAISKRLAEKLGGDIVVESTVGEGSKFTVTVSIGPLEGVKRVERPAEVEVSTEQVGKPAAPDVRLDCRILLAEDGPDNQRLISLVLKKAGADVTVAQNGQIALDRALAARDEGNPFDVILMDMQMPVMDGYEATAKLRAAGYDRPIVALTAHAMVGDREKCIAAGCDEYATKPINRAELISLVASQIGRGREIETLV